MQYALTNNYDNEYTIVQKSTGVIVYILKTKINL